MNIEEIQKQFDLYNNMYRAMSGVLVALPCHPDLIKNVSHYLDTAFLWVKEGMQAACAAATAQAAEPTVDDNAAVGDLENADPAGA